MAAANFSLAVASRRAKYFDGFRVQRSWVQSQSMSIPDYT
jgi:hypothetical protein